MSHSPINRIDYRNKKKELDFEIVDIQDFYHTRPHAHLKRDFRLNFWVMIYIIEGSGAHYVDFQKYNYTKGDIIFLEKNQVQHFEPNDEVKGYIVHINEPFFYKIQGFDGDIFLEFIDRASGSLVMNFGTSTSKTNRVLIDLIYKEYNNKEEKINVELIATLFQGFILALGQQVPNNHTLLTSRNYKHFTKFRQLVEAHYWETRNVEDYAKMMNYSKKTINQASRAVAGLSAKQFIINRVVLEAKRYLSQGELMNYEIAHLLGFEEAANMTKFFKHYEGVSPKEFRESIGLY